MQERIDRKEDQSLYQPKIHSDRIRVLYQLKRVTGKPMTVLLDQAIRELAERHSTVYSLEVEPVTDEVQAETWEEYKEYSNLLDEMDYLECLEELEKLKNHE